MSRKLRVFVSSTMKDLANERDAVCRRLREFNFEPINAEAWLPGGKDAWTRIDQEIDSSDVFVLLLGERYGWIPNEGPQAGTGLSVTHLEYKAARERDIPILPFLRKLGYDTERESEDAKKRDAFRSEIAAWAGGGVVKEFTLARDLADSVGHALVALLTDDFLSDRIRARAATVDRSARLLQSERRAASKVTLPAPLVEAVARREAVLLAGSGISHGAGLPAASVFVEHMAQILYVADPDYGVSPVGSAFSAIAADVQATTSRDYLVREVQKLVDPPQGIRPTAAHLQAVNLFDLICTTNWDHLFEDAATAQGQSFAVISGETTAPLPPRAIVKLHGSFAEPDSLLLTEADIYGMDKTRPQLWQSLRELLRGRTLVVVGSSLRDPSVVRLMHEAERRVAGYYVCRRVFVATAARVRAFGLECITADADAFFAQLSAKVGARA
jgi:hypothetical protein